MSDITSLFATKIAEAANANLEARRMVDELIHSADSDRDQFDQSSDSQVAA